MLAMRLQLGHINPAGFVGALFLASGILNFALAGHIIRL
jgi:hypothetical protein